MADTDLIRLSVILQACYDLSEMLIQLPAEYQTLRLQEAYKQIESAACLIDAALKDVS